MVKLLRDTFTKKGISYKLLEKNKSYVLYECSTEDYKYYEIFKYKIQPFPKMFENPEGYDEMEVYPSDEQFGLWAWCCSNMNRVEYIKKVKNL